MKKAQRRRKGQARVDLWVSDCGKRAQLYVDQEPMPEACSKEHLLAQVVNLIRTGNVSYARAKSLLCEIVSIRRMCNTRQEAEAVLRRKKASEKKAKALFASRPFVDQALSNARFNRASPNGSLGAVSGH